MIRQGSNYRSFLKHSLTLTAGLFLANPNTLASEGMWQPEQLPEIEADLRAQGLELDPSSLTDLTSFPMNAIVSLGGCSASFVSPKGLVITNHHCAYKSIQFNSTEENNLLDKGFYAASLDKELPAAPGTRVYVTESIQDVTDEILKELEDVNGNERFKKIETRKKAMIESCEKEFDLRCRIDAFFGDSSYRLTRQLEIRDVRLVQAPPSAIGKFGGDVDNWMWPRHTGDFTFYRAYVGKDGKPADFDSENVPYQPNGYLKIDKSGVQDGSFVMVAGYPGRTYRHKLPSEVGFAFEKNFPRTKRYLDERIAVIELYSAIRPELAVTYASKLASLNNYSKNISGMLTGYEALGLLSQKQQIEQQFLLYLEENRIHQSIADYQKLRTLLKKQDEYTDLSFALRKAKDSAIYGIAELLVRIAYEKQFPNLERESGFLDRDLPRLRQRLLGLKAYYDRQVDEATWKLSLHQLQRQPKILNSFEGFKNLLALRQSELDAKIASFYTSSELEDETYRLKLFDLRFDELKELNDPFIDLALTNLNQEIEFTEQQKDLAGNVQKLRADYMKQFLGFQASLGQAIYPDANSTLRISYGTIQGYTNRQGKSFTGFTTLEEIAEKHTGKDPFDVPELQLELIANADYGNYASEELETVPVNFLADLDITGGNSGSATLNAKGELTGLAFDGVIDGVISNWAFDPKYTRSIHVDVRYILWTLDKFHNATELLQEMEVAVSE